MNGIRTTGVGVALALAAAPGLAQTPPAVPAATLGRVSVVEGPVTEPVVRGAAPDNRPVSLFPPAAYRTQAGQPPSGGGQLPPPKPADGPQPNVTETRTPPGTTPAPGTPPTYVLPGSYQPPVSGPVVGGAMTPCVPYAGATTMATPVAPSPPAYVASDGGFLEQPRLQDPYWGSQWDPLFPRARAVAGAVVAPFTNGRLVLGAEYLMWWVRAQATPPLLTTSSPAFNGIIGQGDTQVLYGNQAATNTFHNGARFSAAYWFNDLWALDGNVWFLATNSGGYSADSSQYPVLARPFVSANTGANFAQLIASPNLSTGAAVINNQTSLWGNEINLRRAVVCLPCARVDALIGFRNMNLTEEINITESFARTPNSNTGIGVPTVTSGVVQDRFRTENQFYGVNLGLTGEMRRGWWFMSTKVAVGLGTVNQQATINGFQQLNTNTGGVISASGGLLAVPGANIGSYSQSRFGVLPEVGLTVGVYVTPNVRLGVGYNFMYLNSVVRPAGQIDPVLDVTRIPNFPVGTVPAAATVRPSGYPLKTSDFFVQGITFSLMWSF